jgi:hypothetical protein
MNASSLLERFRGVSPARRGLLIVLVVFIGLLLISRTARLTVSPGIQQVNTPPVKLPHSALPQDAALKAEWQRLKESSRLPVPVPPMAGGTSEMVAGGSNYETPPLISHAAELAVTTKEFSRSRSSMEDILERHRGYASKLRMVGEPSGSLLTATLRVPSSEFASVVTDLKTLGKVEHEEQTADEITQQRADLEARLTNAQNRLRRLQEWSAKVDKWGTPLDVQRQLSAVSAEIARLEAERVSYEHRVTFSNVLFSMKEEITPPVETFAAQFRKTALAGLSDALSSLSAIALFAIGYGPMILVWFAVIFLPARWMWKKWHPAIEPAANETAESA